MGKKSNKSSKYLKIAIVLIVILLCYFFFPTSQNHYSNTYKLRSTSKSGEPIKLQFRNGFENDHYKPAKKSTFMQKRMENNKDGKKTNFLG